MPRATAARPKRHLDATERHTHRIEVETGNEPVHVTVGERSPAEAAPRAGHVPGGFAKFFNRVIDVGVWAQLPDAARAVYLALVRLADGHGPFRARVVVAGLMKHSGLSRSSVKRGLKALQDYRLIVVAKAGGVGADNVNRANVYELLVPEPADAEADRPTPQRTQTASRAKGRGGVQTRTPSPSNDEPAAGSSTARRGASPSNPAVDRAKSRTGSRSGPLLRNPTQTLPPDAAGGEVEGEASEAEAVAAAGLARWGIESTEASALVGEHGAQRVSRVLAEVRRLKASGKLRSAAGFVRWSLEESDQADDVAPAAGGGGSPAWDLVEARRRREEATAAEQSREAEDAEIDTLPADALDTLAAEVCERYADHPAMLRLLTSKPPRESRLMRAEIAKLLQHV